MWVQFIQLYKTDKETFRTVNVINMDNVKRIALLAGRPEAELYFHTRPNITKKDEEIEDFILIEILDKKEFVTTFLKQINNGI